MAKTNGPPDASHKKRRWWRPSDLVSAGTQRRLQFDMLAAQFETRFNGANPSETDTESPAGIARKLIADYPESANPPGWPVVYMLHRCLLRLLAPADLYRAGWEFRERYRDMFGKIEFGEYMASRPSSLREPAGTDASVARDLVLADMDQLLDVFYKSYAMGPDNANLLRCRLVVTMSIIGATLILGLTLLKFGCRPITCTEIEAIFGVFLAGAIGGSISTLQRLRQLGGSGDALTDYYEISGIGYTGIFASAAVGALFAGVLYLLFAAGLLNGKMFPRPYGTFDPTDTSLLFAWAFIAGFFERLVPDTLSRLVAKKAE